MIIISYNFLIIIILSFLGADVVADAEGDACGFCDCAALLYFLGGEGFAHHGEDDFWNEGFYSFCKGDEGFVGFFTVN